MFHLPPVFTSSYAASRHSETLVIVIEWIQQLTAAAESGRVDEMVELLDEGANIESDDVRNIPSWFFCARI